MTQAITVFGRIRLFENRIQTRAHGTAPLFPKDKDVKHKTAGSSIAGMLPDSRVKEFLTL